MLQHTQIAAVVLAAGKGSRMKSDLHKVLHRVNHKPMLGHVLDCLADLKADRTVVVVGAGQKQIAAAYPDLETVNQKEQLGTAHAVRTAENVLHGFTGIMLVLYGDVPLVRPDTLRDLLNKIDSDTPLAVLGFRPADTLAYGRLITNQEGVLEKIVEHAEASESERKIDFCNSGILAGDARLLFQLLPYVANDNSKGEYYLTDVVSLARAAGYSVATSEADPLEVTGVNSLEELNELNRKVTQTTFD